MRSSSAAVMTSLSAALKRRFVRKKRECRSSLAPPLQQETSTKLGFGAKKTMQIAQKLYEGLPLASQRGSYFLYAYRFHTTE